MNLNIVRPPITTMPQYTDLLSTILCYENGVNWYYNNYIQLFTDYRYRDYGEIKFRDDFFSLNNINSSFSYRCNPFILSLQTIEDITLIIESSSIIPYFKELINNKYYIIPYVDTHYINNEIRKGSIHAVLFYGYSDTTFKTADFTSNGKYGINEIKSSDVERLYTRKYELPNFIECENRVVAFSLKNADYWFDLEVVKRQFSDYLYEVNTTDSYECIKYFESNEPKMQWGMGCYSCLISYYKSSIADERRYIDLRGLYALCDHKIAMMDRMKYMLKQKFLEDKSVLLELSNVLDNLRTGLNMTIKFNLTHNDEFIVKAVDLLSKTYEHEKRIMERVMKAL